MGVFTFDATTRHESLLDILRDISPTTDNYFVTSLENSTALNTLHEWPTFNLARPTSVTPVAEGADYSDTQQFVPLRSQNITEVLTSPVRVSGTAQAISAAGMGGDPMSFQKKQALKLMKAQMEYRILNAGSLASGASGTARQMVGINGALSTSVTARSSGTSMSVTELEDILQDSWTQVGQEYVADIIVTTIGIKRKIAGFTTRVTVYQDSSDRIYNNISYFEASTGTVKVIPHKDVINATGSTHVFALREDTFRIAFLKGREPFYQDIAQVGDAKRGQYVTEYTLESLAQRASVKRIGYALAG